MLKACSEKYAYNVLFIIAVIFIAYCNSLGNGFVWVDQSQILNKGLIIENFKDFVKVLTANINYYAGSLAKRGDYYRPFVNISFSIDYFIWKFNPLGYHLSSIVLHLISAILIFKIFSFLLKDSLSSLLVSLLFAAHPVLAASVTWISGRADPLCALFFLASFYLYIRAEKASRSGASWLYWAALLCFFFALLSKEMAITLPAIILLYWYFFQRRPSQGEKRRGKSPYQPLFYIVLFFAVAAFYLLLRVAITSGVGAGLPLFRGNPYQIFLTMAKVIFDYLGLLILPVTLTISDAARVYTSIWQRDVLISLLVIVLLIIMAVLAAKKYKETSFAVLWFFVTLFPISNIIPAKHFRAERFLYIPYIGLFLLLAVGFRELLKLKNSSTVIVSVALISAVLCGRTIWRNRDFKDDFTLFSKTIRQSPYCNEAHLVFANLNLKSNNLPVAIEEYQKALFINPHYITFKNFYEAHNNLGLALARAGFLDEAIAHFKQAREICPDCDEARNNLNIALSKKAQLEERPPK